MKLWPVILGVVVVVAGIAFYSWRKADERYHCKMRQSEGKQMLLAIARGEKSYRERHQQYSADPLDVTIATQGQYYDFKITLTQNGFEATAKGKNQAVGDEWRITETGEPAAVADKCGR